MEEIAKERLERVARLYGSNAEAGRALGIASGSFRRACRRHGIETPGERHRRKARRGSPQPGRRDEA
ncbi:MAG: hypothetical protein AB1505_11690 [Candidatus Latescibacterota bacterium]